MSKVYSDAFTEQASVKVYSRGKRTLQNVADELHVNLTFSKTKCNIFGNL